MGWKTDWVNLFVDDRTPGVDESIRASAGRLVVSRGVDFRSGGTTKVRLVETDRSGSIIRHERFDTSEVAVGEFEIGSVRRSEFTANGDAEVYLSLRFEGGNRRFLSAPLHTSVQVSGLEHARLVVLAPVEATNDTSYRFAFNAHFVFSVATGGWFSDGTKYEIEENHELGLDSIY